MEGKNMKKMRFAVVCLAAMALVTSMLTGCGKKSSPARAPQDGAFVPKTELELTIWNTQGTDYVMPQDIPNNVVETWLYDKTKIKVENIYGNDGGQWDTKLYRLVASDNMPHIVYCGAGQGPAHFMKLKELDQVWEITPELLDKYAPNLKKRVDTRLWEKIKIGGKIYGIPMSSRLPAAIEDTLEPELRKFIKENYEVAQNDVTIEGGQSLWIRDDIAKTLFPDAKSYDQLVALLEEKQARIGDDLLDIPVYSTDDYVKMMYDIKNLNLKENGKTVFPFGYTGGDNWVALSWLGADMLGYKKHYYTGAWNDNTQRMEFPLAGDIVKRAAKIQNQMLRENVIDPESLAHTIAEFKEKVMNGLYAIAPLTIADRPDNINNELAQRGKPFRYRPLYTQVPALPGNSPYREPESWGEAICILKTVSEEQLPQVLNWLDVQVTDEFQQVLWWGSPEDGLYTETEDGKRQFNDPRFTEYFVNGDKNALKYTETRGLGVSPGFLNSFADKRTSVWSPNIMYRKVNLMPVESSGFSFSLDSPHTQNIKNYPPCQIWSVEYTEIPEVVAIWGSRQQWETPFKLAMAADSDENFEIKWNEALEKLNQIADIKKMEDEMTKIAKPIADKINASSGE